MPRSSRDRSSLAVLVAAAALVVPAAAHADTAAQIGEQIVVRHAAAQSAGERADVRADAEVALDERLLLPGVEVVDVVDGSRAEALTALRGDPGVVWAEPNRVVQATTDDPYWPLLWGLENDGTPFGDSTSGVADADIDAPRAWSVSEGAGVTVGVVDTGVQASHPDLAGQSVTGKNFVSDGHATPADGHGHGTHVAGTIAAARNTEGVVGVAPAAKVMALRALGDDGTGSSAGVANAFAYAGSKGLRVVNASLGSPSPTLAEQQAITGAPNTLFVVAAGNDGKNVDGGGAYPCAYAFANVLCVGASDSEDRLASFSNRGAIAVDLVAPGQRIASTWIGSSYGYASGTSMASPMAAGTAALVVAAHPGWSPAEIKAALMDSVDRPAGVAGATVTGGRLNAARALGVDPDGNGSPTPAPVPTPTPMPTPTPVAPKVATPVATTPPAEATPEPTTPAPTNGAPATGQPAANQPTTGSPTVPSPTPVPAPLPTLTPSRAPAPTAPISNAPGGGTGAAPATGSGSRPGSPTGLPVARLTRLRVVRAKGRVQAVGFQLSAAASIRVQVQRRGAGGRNRAVRSAERSFDLPAGAIRLPVGKGAKGLGLTRGAWKVSISFPGGRGTVAVRVR